MTPGRVPAPPETYVAHPTAAAIPFVDRAREIALLSHWAADGDAGPLLTISGLGGMGKSSLAWEWFTRHEKAGEFQGRMWWSFYEANAFQFFAHCYSYLTGRPVIENQRHRPEELVGLILERLQAGTFLLVLDGIEREMVAYSSPAENDATAVLTSHRMRRAASDAMSEFLYLSATINSASKLLLTSRLAPAEVEDGIGRPLRGTRVLQIGGLDQSSTAQLLSQLGITDRADEVFALAAATQYHPLLISLLTRQILTSIDDPTFTLQFAKPGVLQDVAKETLAGAVRRMGRGARQVAEQIASFGHPVDYSTLAAMLVGEGCVFARESELDQALSRLQDFGMISWNQFENTYTSHPIIRSPVWEAMSDLLGTG